MLKTLYIDNVAVIEHATVDLLPGLNVFTGETGAGKSILISAVGAVLGHRTSKDIIRKGCNKASIFAEFCDLSREILDKIAKLGYECEDNSLILSREVLSSGANSCKVNGKPANVGILRQIGQMLLVIHGQHDSVSLLNEEMHLSILDRYGDMQPLLDEYLQLYTDVRKTKKQLQQLQQISGEQERMSDILAYQIREIDAAKLTPGEEETLVADLNRAKYALQIQTGLHAADNALSGSVESDGALQLIQQAIQAMDPIGEYVPDILQARDRLKEMSYEIEEYANTVSSLVDTAEEAPDIDQLENRLELIHQLKKKYGQSIDEILSYREQCSAKLDSITHSDEEIERLLQELKQKISVAKDKAIEITARRRSAAAKLQKSICNQLAYLNMPHVTFEVQITTQNKLTPTGMDTALFMISANAGEEARSIAKIASGGELSRIMLAIQSILAEKDGIPTIIFDEIDTGVSGSAAQKIGSKLKETSRSHQVICVTHQAQLAAYADNHLFIQKQVSDGRTYTSVSSLSKEQRINELARIISGDHITKLSLQNAEEIIKFAQKA